MKESKGAICTDLVSYSSPQQCSSERSSPSSRESSSHSLLLLQLRTELEGKWRPDKLGILRRWINASPKHWLNRCKFCQKEDVYDDAIRPGMIIRKVRNSNVPKRVHQKQKARNRNPIRLKTAVMERFVRQVSPSEEACHFVTNNGSFVHCRGEPDIPSEKNQRRARRFMLEEEVMVLQKRLQKEIDLHLALQKAISPASAVRPRRPQDVPTSTRELLEDIASLEEVVAALEDQSAALQHEIGYVRKEREYVEQRHRSALSNCCQSSSADPSSTETTLVPDYSRQVPRSRRTILSSTIVQQHSEQTEGPDDVVRLEDRLSSTSLVRSTSQQPTSPVAHPRAVRISHLNAPTTVQSSSKKLPVEAHGLSSLAWKPRAIDRTTSSQETSISTAVSSDFSSKHSFLSAFDPHNRVQSSAAILQPDSGALTFSLSPARYSFSGASTSDQSSSCGLPGGREQDNGSLSHSVSEFFPLPSSPSTPEHRSRPTSPAGVAAAGLLRFRCDDALPTEEMYLKQQMSRRNVPPDEEQRSPSVWGMYASEEFYTPENSSSGGVGDHLSGESQPSSAEKRSKARVKLNFHPDDTSAMTVKKPSLLNTKKKSDAEDATRQSLMYDLLSPGEKLGILPIGCPGSGHDKHQFRDYSQTPNLLSEEMIKCMVSIYWHLADPAVIIRNRSFYDNIPSPTSHFGHTTLSSSFSSISESSLLSFVRSPLVDQRIKDDVLGCEGTPDPFKVRGRIPWADIGMYGKALEVSWMSVSTDQLGFAAQALYKFRLLVEKLPLVDLRVMSHSQKLAFWLNLYNSLMMHAYLAYGIPRNDLKYFALLQKATYNVGGHSFNAATIEYSLLRGKTPSYRPQIKSLMAVHRNKWGLTEEQSKFAIDYPEPQMVFALCCGARSSPAVRLYTARHVHKEINVAFKDYVRATVGLNGKGKCLVPKLLYTYAHEFVDDGGLLDWICQFLPASQAGLVLECWQHRQNRLLGAGKFAVLPFELTFRYLFSPIFDPSLQ